MVHVSVAWEVQNNFISYDVDFQGVVGLVGLKGSPGKPGASVSGILFWGVNALFQILHKKCDLNRANMFGDGPDFKASITEIILSVVEFLGRIVIS